MASKHLITKVPFQILKIGDRVHVKDKPDDAGIIYHLDSDTKDIGIYWGICQSKNIMSQCHWGATVYNENFNLVSTFDSKRFEHWLNAMSPSTSLMIGTVLAEYEACKEWK